MPSPLAIGHRGAAAFLPENTLPSFRLAFEKFKADMIEFDVHLTRDGIPVIIHDARLERTTNGRGYVAHHRYGELRKLDAGYRFDPDQSGCYPQRGRGIYIPALDDVFQTFPDRGLAVEIKVKSAELVHAVMALVNRYDARGRVIVGSRYALILKEMRAHFPEIRRFASRNEICRLLFDYRSGKRSAGKDPLLVASMPLRSMGMALADQGWIDYLHEREIRAFYWTVNDAATVKELAGKGADGVISDDPGLVHQALGRTSGTAPTDV